MTALVVNEFPTAGGSEQKASSAFRAQMSGQHYYQGCGQHIKY